MVKTALPLTLNGVTNDVIKCWRKVTRDETDSKSLFVLVLLLNRKLFIYNPLLGMENLVEVKRE